MDLGQGKKKNRSGIVSAGLLVMIWLAGCGMAPDYSLTVTIEDGVSGTPASGRHIYKEFSTVNFEYTADDPRLTVEVMLNNRIRHPGFGTIVMYGDAYELKAAVVDIRGEWKLTMIHNDKTIVNPPPFTIRISGPDPLSGDFSDERGRNGTWTASYGRLILAYYDWDFYTLRGSVFGMGSESGIFSGEGLTGTWKAERVK